MTFFPYLYYIKMSYMTLSSQEKHLFTLFILSRASNNTTSQNIGGTDAWAVPHLKFGGPSPLGIRPCVFYRRMKHPPVYFSGYIRTANDIFGVSCSATIIVGLPFQAFPQTLKTRPDPPAVIELSKWRVGSRFFCRWGVERRAWGRNCFSTRGWKRGGGWILSSNIEERGKWHDKLSLWCKSLLEIYSKEAHIVYHSNI